MPAIIDRAPITAAILSGGMAPVLLRCTKTAVETAVPPHISTLAKYAGHIQPRVNTTINNQKTRRKFWHHFADGPIALHNLANDERGAEREAESATLTLVTGMH